MSKDLSFKALQEASRKRNKRFRNARGGLAQKPDAKWTPERWTLATMGELGEFANLLKKVLRGDFEVDLEDIKNSSGLVDRCGLSDESILSDDLKTKLAFELADTAIYLGLLADSLNIDLGEAVTQKFNRQSLEMPIPRVMLHDDGYYIEGEEPEDPEEDNEDDLLPWWERTDGEFARWFFSGTYWWQITKCWNGTLLYARRENTDNIDPFTAKQLRGAIPHRLWKGPLR